MSKVIIYPDVSGGINIVMPAPDCGFTVEEIAQMRVPPDTAYKIMENTELPTDYEFRKAWEWHGAEVTTNIDKAKEITKARLREEREPLLQKLDVEMTRNWGNLQKLAEIDSKRQLLRDAPEIVDTMTTLDELKNATLPSIE